MKVVALVFSGFLSTAALAFVHNGAYQGGGNWKGNYGGTGTWSEDVTFSSTKEGHRMQSALTVLDKDGKVAYQESADLTFTANGQSGFFDVLQNGQAVGSGYCYSNTCHYELTVNSEHDEETLHMWDNKIHKIGSHRGTYEGNAFQVAWQGSLTAKP